MNVSSSAVFISFLFYSRKATQIIWLWRTRIEQMFGEIAKDGDDFVVSSDYVDAAQSVANAPDVYARRRDALDHHVAVALEGADREMAETVGFDRLAEMQLRHRQHVARTDVSY